MRLSINIYFNLAPQKTAQRLATRTIGRPGLLLEERRQVGVFVFFAFFCIMRQYNVLLKNTGPTVGKFLHPGSHNLPYNFNLFIGVVLKAPRKKFDGIQFPLLLTTPSRFLETECQSPQGFFITSL